MWALSGMLGDYNVTIIIEDATLPAAFGRNKVRDAWLPITPVTHLM